ncbi:MAG: hypothetical protein ACYCY9_01900 [Thiobacillus sp.]
MRLIVFLMAVAGVLFSLAAQALTDQELSSLPNYCTARIKGSGAEYNQWVQILGRDFDHTHHYCFALNDLNKYYKSRSAKDKKFNLKNAEGNLSYMVNHASPSYSLMPEIYLNRGLTYSLMNQHGKAVADITKALELNPRQVKAYNMLADYYISIKLKNKALETVTKGLRHSPGTKSLQRRYQELGGKMPYPEPLAQTDPAMIETPPSAEQAAVPEVPPLAAPAEKIVTEPDSDKPKIGSPTNPWCRFCPDPVVKP